MTRRAALGAAIALAALPAALATGYLPCTDQPPSDDAVCARVTQYSTVAGPTYYGGWEHPAPGLDVAAASWDIPAYATVWIRGTLPQTIYDRGGGLGNGYPYPWIDTSVDYGFRPYEWIVVGGN